MTADKTIIRTKKSENPFVMIDKYGVNDEHLSWKAKGILVYLLSKPDDWTVRVEDLVKRAKDGRDAVKAGLRELEDNGYLSRHQHRGEKGKFGEIEYIVYERPLTIETEKFKPQTEIPSTDKNTANGNSVSGKSVDGKTVNGKSNTTNNDLTKKELTNNEFNNNNNKEPNMANAVVVDKIQSLLVDRLKTKVNKPTVNRWLKKETYENIMQLIEEIIVRDDIANIAGYITKVLDQGYTPATSSPDKPKSTVDAIREAGSKRKDKLPEWVERQLQEEKERKTSSYYDQYPGLVVEGPTSNELTEEQKKNVNELLRQLGEIE